MANEEYQQRLVQSTRATPTNLWFWEAWLESRDTFKLLAADVVEFLLIMGFIHLGHHIITGLPISESRRQPVEEWHFNVLMTAYALFSLTLILELVLVTLVPTIKRIKEQFQKNTNEEKSR